MSARLELLRALLAEGKLSTQDELRSRLEQRKFKVTQSTISRDLRKLGAVRAIDARGRAVYRLPDADGREGELASGGEIVRAIQANDSIVVIHTLPGAASIVARQIDLSRSEKFLGTIAGDDTVFVALSGKGSVAGSMATVRDILGIAQV